MILGRKTSHPRNVQFNMKSVIFFVAVHLIACLAPFFFSWKALGLALFLYWLTGSIGICLGYHRLLSHRSFKVPLWLEHIIASIGALALEGGPLFWVSGHRQHHSFSEDVDQDPYSATRGLFWSHMGWILCMQPENTHIGSYATYARDLARDKYYRFLEKTQVWYQLALGVLLFILGELMGGLGLSFVIYGIFVRLVWTWHCTWLINSACHKWGYHNFKIKDHSSNLWWAALLTFGEGWHNNHHHWPKCAKAGHKWWEIDMTWWIIRLGQMFGLVTQVSLRKKEH